VVTVAPRDGESRQAVTTALGDLAGLGVTITAVPEPPAATGTAEPGGGWVAHAAKAARSPWVAPWPPGRDHEESYLLDLACARECAQADAVGYHTGAGYGYVTSSDPALARREFFSQDGPDDSRHGLRLFSLS
jgi:hypothetical protein